MKQYFKQKNRYWTCRLLSHLALIVLLSMTGLFMNCQNNHMNKPNTSTGNANNGSTQSTISSGGKTHEVIFSTDDKDNKHGTLTAIVDDKKINSSDPVQEGKTVIFTASPSPGFMVDTWTISGSSFEDGTVTKKGSQSAKVIVKEKSIKVTVSFKKETTKPSTPSPTPPPPIEKHTVTFSVEDKDKAKGMLTAKVGSETINPSTPTPVEEGAKIIFTAQPNSDFMVDTWTVSGSTFENDSKTKTGSNTVTVTVQKENITITVSFKSIYVPVPYAKLDTYLSTASKDEINYIELMGTIPTGDFKGSNRKAGALGQKIKAHPDKKLALKLPETVQGLTDMSNCFYQCTNLISLLNVPQSVTTMKNSFYDCTNLATAPVLPESTQNLEFCFGRCSSLTEAPVIPVNVINLSYCFEQCKKLQSVTLTCKCPATEPARENAFLLCTALHTGSIKVPDTQLETYKNDAQYMGAQESWFVADTK